MMRKVLSSSNALMIAVLALLMAVALWTVFGAGDEPDASGVAEDQSTRQTSTARGGGPIEEPDETGEDTPPELDTPDLEGDQEDEADEPPIEQPVLEEPALEQPTLEAPRSEEPTDPEESVEPEGPEQAQEAGEAQTSQRDNEVDQEAAYSQDEAPEAEVIGVQPADSDEGGSREGGGPLEEREDDQLEEREEDEREVEAVEAPGEGESTSQQPVDQDRLEADDAGDESPVDDQMREVTDEADEQEPDGEAEADESRIERPGLRSAPRPSRPGEESMR